MLITMMKTPLKKEDYRIIFKAVLLNFQKKDPELTLRAFARKIALAPSMLSDVMSGKKILSFERGEAILGALGVHVYQVSISSDQEQLRDFFSVLLHSKDEEAKALVQEFLRSHECVEIRT